MLSLLAGISSSRWTVGGPQNRLTEVDAIGFHSGLVRLVKAERLKAATAWPLKPMAAGGGLGPSSSVCALCGTYLQHRT